MILPRAAYFAIPAFTNTISSLPFSRLICANRRSRSRRFDTSPCTAVTFRPISLTAAANSGSRRPVMKTCAPSLTNCFAVAKPMPLLPPVMSAVFPTSLFMCSAPLIKTSDCEDVAALLEAVLERLPDDGGRGRTGDGLREGVHFRGQSGRGGKRRSVDEALDVGQREQVKARDPLREGIDEANELRVGNGAVDVPIPLGEVPVEVLATEQDFECPPATDHPRQTGRRAASGHGGEPDLELPQHGPLPTGEADVGGEDELAARTASSAPKGADRHRPRPA